ncbi:hypothetical protein Droror1_Dr00009730 [Drosera rotundifolia]
MSSTSPTRSIGTSSIKIEAIPNNSGIEMRTDGGGVVNGMESGSGSGWRDQLSGDKRMQVKNKMFDKLRTVVPQADDPGNQPGSFPLHQVPSGLQQDFQSNTEQTTQDCKFGEQNIQFMRQSSVREMNMSAGLEQPMQNQQGAHSQAISMQPHRQMTNIATPITNPHMQHVPDQSSSLMMMQQLMKSQEQRFASVQDGQQGAQMHAASPLPQQGINPSSYVLNTHGTLPSASSAQNQSTDLAELQALASQLDDMKKKHLNFLAGFLGSITTSLSKITHQEELKRRNDCINLIKSVIDFLRTPVNKIFRNYTKEKIVQTLQNIDRIGTQFHGTSEHQHRSQAPQITHPASHSSTGQHSLPSCSSSRQVPRIASHLSTGQQPMMPSPSLNSNPRQVPQGSVHPSTVQQQFIPSSSLNSNPRRVQHIASHPHTGQQQIISSPMLNSNARQVLQIAASHSSAGIQQKMISLSQNPNACQIFPPSSHGSSEHRQNVPLLSLNLNARQVPHPASHSFAGQQHNMTSPSLNLNARQVNQASNRSTTGHQLNIYPPPLNSNVKSEAVDMTSERNHNTVLHQVPTRVITQHAVSSSIFIHTVCYVVSLKLKRMPSVIWIEEAATFLQDPSSRQLTPQQIVETRKLQTVPQIKAEIVDLTTRPMKGEDASRTVRHESSRSHSQPTTVPKQSSSHLVQRSSLATPMRAGESLLRMPLDCLVDSPSAASVTSSLRTKAGNCPTDPVTSPSVSTSKNSPALSVEAAKEVRSDQAQVENQLVAVDTSRKSAATETPGKSACFLPSTPNNNGNLPPMMQPLDSSLTNPNEKGNSLPTKQPLERLLEAVQKSSTEAAVASEHGMSSVLRVLDLLPEPFDPWRYDFITEDDFPAAEEYFSPQVTDNCSKDYLRSAKRRRTIFEPEPRPVDGAMLFGDFPGTFENKRAKCQGHNYELLEEIQKANNKFVDTWINVVPDANREDAATGLLRHGTTVRFTYTPLTFRVPLMHFASSPPLPLDFYIELFVPGNYPDAAPEVLFRSQRESSNESEYLREKAMERFNTCIRTLNTPILIEDMARAWDKSARGVCSEIADQLGFHSKFGTWEYVSAA